jgi:spore coat protein U-like protein
MLYRFSIFVFALFCTLQLHAGELNAVLNTQIELLAACLINDQTYLDPTTGLDFGQIDFGEISASSTGTMDAVLSNQSLSSIKIQCSGLSTVNISFGAGLHDDHVPAALQNRYFHALSNGTDYVAYNLIYGDERQVLRPEQSISLSGGTTLEIKLYGQAILDAQRISTGLYRDAVPVTIEF